MSQRRVQIQVRGVQKQFRNETGEMFALKDIELDIYDGEFLCLLGPSGCGKSTLLNMIGGFSAPSAGQLLINGSPVRAPGPETGMVFQEYALFPWMTVTENIEFGLRLAKRSKPFIADKVRELLQVFSLSEFAQHFPKDLSGGMRQRVAIARVLALDSPILLMDEPFGALDALTRRVMQEELIRVWSQYKKTTIFVTHAIDEALYLADRVVLMSRRPGRIQRILTVDVPRPRDPDSPELVLLRREVAAAIMHEPAEVSALR